MGKLKAKKKSNIISRTKAIRYLAVSLSQFRFLTILSGIYPTVPTGKGLDPNRIYYNRKDIKFIRNSPLVDYLREYKIYLKHRRDAMRDGDTVRAESLKLLEPKLPIAQILKDRYFPLSLSFSFVFQFEIDILPLKML